MTDYELLLRQAEGLLGEETDPIANAANLSALVYETVPDLNWAGFYFRRGEELVLGPFQGRPACVRIALGRGVCGRAAASGEVLRVDDVHAFDDHIVCDAASASELVVPLTGADGNLGVFDLDSPKTARFSEQDAAGLAAIARLWVSRSAPL